VAGVVAAKMLATAQGVRLGQAVPVVVVLGQTAQQPRLRGQQIRAVGGVVRPVQGSAIRQQVEVPGQ